MFTPHPRACMLSTPVRIQHPQQRRVQRGRGRKPAHDPRRVQGVRGQARTVPVLHGFGGLPGLRSCRGEARALRRGFFCRRRGRRGR